jgi:hypothetical protein
MTTQKGKVQLVAHIPPELAEKFKAVCSRRKQPQTDVLEALARLWIQLPIEIQARLLSDEEFSESTLESLIHQIAEQVVILSKESKKHLSDRPAKSC